MRIRRSRLTPLLAATVGLVAAGAFTVPASAAPSYTADQLARVDAAVAASGVDGIAWRVDAASRRVVVTADESVSAAELAT
ncbi:alpha-lytic protease prodomain-containing protein, partial [Micromonospora sp. NPDC003776]